MSLLSWFLLSCLAFVSICAQQLQFQYTTWPNGIVPYVIDDEEGLGQIRVQTIYNAMQEIENQTCVKFTKVVDRSKPYVEIISGQNCWSYIGNTQFMPQGLSLSWDGPITCVSHGQILHELMHTLGFTHEHLRPDRNRYVKIKWENIHESKFVNFDIVGTVNAINGRGPLIVDVGYDYESITHVHNKAWSKHPWLKTIVAIDQDGNENVTATAMLGQREHLSEKDVLKIQLLYGCPIAEAASKTTTPTAKLSPRKQTKKSGASEGVEFKTR